MQRAPHKLEYHRHTGRAKFHWKKWTAWASAVLLLAAVGIITFVELPKIRHAWYQQQCLIYEGDPQVAVFDNRPSALASFHRSGSGWINGALPLYNQSGPKSSIPFVAFIPPVLEQFDPALRLKIMNPLAVVFMHLRVSSSGNRRLVIVEAIPIDGLAYSVIDPQTRDVVTSVNLVSNLHARAGMWDLDSRPVAIFSGQIDKLHPDHFTIPYKVADTSFAIDGWLQDDDSIRMVDSGLTPASRPSPASAH